jgi:hypothetical protein
MIDGFRGMLALRAGDTIQARRLFTRSLQNHGRRVTAGIDRILWPANAFVYELAAIQYAQRDYEGAKRTLADLYPPFDALPFVTPGEELKGMVFAALGDTATAMVALKNFIGLWDKADLPLQPRVAAARELLARLERK